MWKIIFLFFIHLINSFHHIYYFTTWIYEWFFSIFLKLYTLVFIFSLINLKILHILYWKKIYIPAFQNIKDRPKNIRLKRCKKPSELYPAMGRYDNILLTKKGRSLTHSSVSDLLTRYKTPIVFFFFFHVCWFNACHC